MKSMRLLALVTSALLLTAPLTSTAFADGTTATGTTTGTTTQTGGSTGTGTTDGSGTTGGTTSTGGTTDPTGGTTDPTGGSTGTTTSGGTTDPTGTSTGSGSGSGSTTDGSGGTTTTGGTGVCQVPPGDDGSDGGSTDGGTGTTDPTGGSGGTVTGDPTAPTDGSTGTQTDGSGSTTTTGTTGTTGTTDSGGGGVVVPQMDFGGGHSDNHKGPHHGDDGQDNQNGGWGWNNWGGNGPDPGHGPGGVTTTGTGTVNLCAPHDNGKHLGWTKKIQNMLNHLDQMRKAIVGFENELNMLLQWAQQNGDTNSQTALQSIHDSLSAEVQANQANVQDMQTLAETQDKLHNVDGAVQTLEQALTVDPTNQDLYTQLSQNFVEKGDHSVKVFVKGKTPNFDVKPTILNNRTMVPLRAIGDALNAQVGWDATTKTITLNGQNGNTVKLVVNSKTATVNGQKETLDAPATVVNGRTLVPLRAVGNFFGLNVTWDSNAQMAVLN